MFNAGEFVEQAIDSIIRQHEKNWELIVVDDFSNDNSAEIVNRISKNDDRIQLISNTLKGIIPALSLGLTKAQGKLVTRMDADDIMTEDKLALLSEPLMTAENSYTVGCVSYFSSMNEPLGDGYQQYANWLNQTIRSESFHKQKYRECVLPSCTWMARLQDIKDLGGFESLEYPEDYDWCFKLLYSSLMPITVDRSVHKWRDHRGRTSRNSETYRDNRFFELKCDWFFNMEYDADHPPIIWGAGRNGKDLAKIFIEKQMDFIWVTNNTKKHGKEIYGHIIHPLKVIVSHPERKVLLVIANKEQKKEAQQFIINAGLSETNLIPFV
jgi:glycosyltransferase involved in cell wall biosynthesis